MLVHVRNTDERRQKLRVAQRHARWEPPIVAVLKGVVAPFEPVPEGGIVVARDNDLLVEYKTSIGAENFERLIIDVS